MTDFRALEDEYALPLTATLWLGDEGLVFLQPTECLEVTVTAAEDREGDRHSD